MNIAIIISAEYLFLVSVLLFLTYLLYVWRNNKKKFISLTITSVISFPLTLLVAKISEYVIYDPRPFVVEHVKPLIFHIADNGFPSDHTLLTATIAAIIFVYNRKLGILLFIICFLVGNARILAQIHHPLDIIGAIFISISATYFAWKVTRNIKRLPFNKNID